MAKTLICQESNTLKDSGSMTTLSCKWPILGFDENSILSKSLFGGTANVNPYKNCSNNFFWQNF